MSEQEKKSPILDKLSSDVHSLKILVEQLVELVLGGAIGT